MGWFFGVVSCNSGPVVTPTPIHHGTRWETRVGGGARDVVVVVRVTSGGKVMVKRKSGETQPIPVSVFLNQYTACNGGAAVTCRNCGAPLQANERKYCHACQRTIVMVRSKAKKEGPVLTTTDTKLIEERREKAPVPPPPAAPAPAKAKPARLYRVTGRRYVEQSMDVDAVSAGEAEELAVLVGLEVTRVELLEP